MTHYTTGRRIEYRVVEILRSLGYLVIRSAGSHGLVDVVGLRKDGVVLVQCKRGGKMGLRDRLEFWREATAVGATALIAGYPNSAKKLEFAVLDKEPKRGDNGRMVALKDNAIGGG